jgi:hypothetical protein
VAEASATTLRPAGGGLVPLAHLGVARKWTRSLRGALGGSRGAKGQLTRLPLPHSLSLPVTLSPGCASEITSFGAARSCLAAVPHAFHPQDYCNRAAGRERSESARRREFRHLVALERRVHP